ncbi:MAG: polyprenyl synthetase family protein [bacterium]
MNSKNRPGLNSFLEAVGAQIRFSLLHAPFLQQLGKGLIKDRLLDYVIRGGKNMRPAMTCLACGALGGEPEHAIDVGIAIEMTHTWTLVHDDIIDRDETRRGGPSIHAAIRMEYLDWQDHNPAMTPDHLGLSMALLIGDAQHAMAMDILSYAGRSGRLPPELALYLIGELEGKVLVALLSGEVDDIFQTGIPLNKITREEILLMLERKTGALLTFSVVSGGLVALGTPNPTHPYIQALKTYGNNLGIAFQLKDDILGITGNEQTLGKPIGSDFKEGKRTLAVKTAWENASPNEKKRIETLLGKTDLKEDEALEMRSLVISTGALDQTERLASQHIDLALEALMTLPETHYRNLLADIATFTITRKK